MSTEAEIRNVDLSKLVPNKYNPRKRTTKKHLASLMKSIKEDGQLQTLLVRPIDGDKFEVVAGIRRYIVLKDLYGNKGQVPCTVRKMDDETAMMLAYKENLEREQLNPIDDAAWFFGMLSLKHEQLFIPKGEQREDSLSPVPTDENPSVQELAKKLGQTSSMIEKRLPLLALPSELQDLLMLAFFSETPEGKAQLNIGKAEAIARLRLIGDKEEAHKHMKEVWRKWGDQDTDFINEQVTKIIDTFKQNAEDILKELETVEKNLEKRVEGLEIWIGKDVTDWLNPKAKSSIFSQLPKELTEDGLSIPQMRDRADNEGYRDYAQEIYEGLDGLVMDITRNDTLDEKRDNFEIQIDRLKTGMRDLHENLCVYCGNQAKQKDIENRVNSLQKQTDNLEEKIATKDNVRGETERLRRELGSLIRKFDDISGDYLASLDKLVKADKITKEEHKERLDKYNLE